jgi:hypothetical protein
MEAFAGPVYPTWPSSFPPPQSALPQQMMPISEGSPGMYQPVGNFHTSAPSYWFAR